MSDKFSDYANDERFARWFKDGRLIDTCLDRFKKGELVTLALLHKIRLLEHIEKRFDSCDTREHYEHFIRAATTARGGNMKGFWLIFLKDPATGVIHCTGYGHNN